MYFDKMNKYYYCLSYFQCSELSLGLEHARQVLYH